MKPTRQEVLRERAHSNPRCPECVSRLESPEVYTVTRYRDNRVLAFDIDLAYEFCQDGRAPVEIPADVVDAILQVNGITPEHVDHVDPSYPGISCPVDFMPDGEPIQGLIDGSHRASRCRRESRPFFAFRLKAEEAQRCQETAAARLVGYLELLLRDSASH